MREPEGPHGVKKEEIAMANPNEDNKALVLAGIRGVFVDRDPAVLDRLFSDDYRQHNPQIPNGTGAIKAVLQNLSADFKYESGVVVADGDYVMVHGRYVGWGPKPMSGWIFSAWPMGRSRSIGTFYRKRSRLRRAPMEIACSLARRLKNILADTL
jgi:predicted SnoaL-like aldol condensation-catalyzing enzyme